MIPGPCPPVPTLRICLAGFVRWWFNARMESPRRYLYRRSWWRIALQLVGQTGCLLILLHPPASGVVSGALFRSQAWQWISCIVLLGPVLGLASNVLAVVSRLRGTDWLEVQDDAVVVPHWITLRPLRLPMSSIQRVYESVKGEYEFLSSLAITSSVGTRIIDANLFQSKAEYDEVRDFIHSHPQRAGRWSRPRTEPVPTAAAAV